MFVEMTKEEGITPISIDTWIKKEREDGFTPDEAMQVLKWSNFYGNIKAVVKEIRVYNDVRVYRMFKSFIISAVDGRETSKDSYAMLRDLAVECGFEEEFDKANDKPKVYEKTDFCSSMYYGIESWYKDLDEKATVIHISNASITNLFANTKKKAPKKLVMMDCKQIEFAKCVEMDRFVAIKVAEVKLNAMDLLPKNIELSDCGVVNFCGSNLTDANIKLKKCGKVIFDKDTKFPEVLDLSEVDEVDLSNCDLANVKEIKFKKGAKVNLEEVENLSPSIDLTAPDELDLSGVDVSYIEDRSVLGVITYNRGTKFPKKMFFKQKEVDIFDLNIANCEEVVFAPSVKKVWFDNDTKLPEVLDLSEVDEVYLSGCDLANVKEIKFKKGAKVNLSDVRNLSQSIDLTAPAELDLSGIDVSYIEDSSVLGVITGDSATVYPKKMTFIDEKVKIDNSNIEKCEEVVFAPSVKNVWFDSDTKLPEVLDLSEVDEVDLSFCDLANVKEIKFKKGAKVDLAKVKNLSPSIDLSGPSEIDICGTDVSFVEDSSVWGEFTYDANTRLPKKTTFTDEEVKICGKNIENCEEVVFAPSVKKVWFNKDIILPEILDLSQCDDVKISGFDVKKMKRVMFRDEEQRDKILENMNLWPFDRLRLKRKSEYAGDNIKKNSKTICVPQRGMGE